MDSSPLPAAPAASACCAGCAASAASSLIELLAVLPMLAVVLLGIYALYNVGAKSQQDTDNRVRSLIQQQNGLERISREMRQATAITPVSSQIIDGTTWVRPSSGGASVQRRVRYDCSTGTCQRWEGAVGGALSTGPVTVISERPERRRLRALAELHRSDLRRDPGRGAVKGASNPITLDGGFALRNLADGLLMQRAAPRSRTRSPRLGERLLADRAADRDGAHRRRRRRHDRRLRRLRAARRVVAQQGQVGAQQAQAELDRLSKLQVRPARAHLDAHVLDRPEEPQLPGSGGNLTVRSGLTEALVTTAGEGETAQVDPGPEDFAVGSGGSTITGKIYRYVTWRDENCPATICDGTQNTKRVTVAVTRRPAANTRAARRRSGSRP